MRRATDLTAEPAPRRFGARTVFVVLGVALLFVLVFGRAIARFYVDFLWHDALGRTDVFTGVITAKLTLFVVAFAVFALLAGLNLYLADRMAPAGFPANVHPYVERFHEVFGHRLRLIRYGAALLFALLMALPPVAQWQSYLLFRNSQSFGVADDQFGADVGFYVFQLPFLTFVLNWLFAALLIVILLTVVAHVLNGGVVFVTPTPMIRQSTKSHLAVLLAVLAVLKAADYWLERYELTNSRRGIVQGATYAVVNAQIPALMLLILIALLTAGLFLSVVRTGSFRLPLLASALWLVVSIVGGIVYPALVQSLVVNPNQESREETYITRNVTATQMALGLTNVEVQSVEFGTVTASALEEDLQPMRNTRLLNPAAMRNRFLFDRGEVAGLTIDDLDVDRYELDGEERQVLIAARELQLSGVTNKSWQGLHLINTRGCGLVLAPAGSVRANQRPDYQTVELDRPEMYFSPTLSGYAIANSDSTERECDEPHRYEGASGVEMSSFLRRAGFALAFLDYNVLGSGAINDDSQMLWVRSVNDRLQKLAPFLSFDADPYPVAVDGRVVWVTDAYTETSRYPYAQSIGDIQRPADSGLSASANYVRNSVKAVVDAYTGEVTFYVADEQDPILRAWRSVFPDLFTSIDEMPVELQEHLRYPEDLFWVQTDMYSKYRLDPALFFQRDGNAWSVAQSPGTQPNQRAVAGTGAAAAAAPEEQTAARDTFATESDAPRFVPYYTLFDNGGAADEFVMLRPFVPFSTADTRVELQAYMTVSSEPENYGQLTTYIVESGPGGDLPDGPARVASNAESTPEISRRISLDNQTDGGTQVRFGDMQLVPIAGGLVYIRPYYVSVPLDSADAREVTEFRAVIVSYDDRSVIAPTIGQGLARLFPGFDGDVGDRVLQPGEEVPDDLDDLDTGLTDDDGTEVSDPSTDPSTDRPSSSDPVDETDPVAMLERVEVLFDEADAALRAGDLGEYQAKLDEARAMLDDALALLGTTATGEPVTETTDPAG
jgi:hypothetical protein